MDHTAGLRSWQWIFILEGMATFIVGMFNPTELFSTPFSNRLTLYFIRCGRILPLTRLS